MYVHPSKARCNTSVNLALDGQEMDLGLDDISFHDSELHRVVENPEMDDLVFEVLYPVDWDSNNFEKRRIVFVGFRDYSVSEGPFAGKPSILQVTQISHDNERAKLRIETNAGERTLRCKKVRLDEGWGAV